MRAVSGLSARRVLQQAESSDRVDSCQQLCARPCGDPQPRRPNNPRLPQRPVAAVARDQHREFHPSVGYSDTHGATVPQPQARNSATPAEQ